MSSYWEVTKLCEVKHTVGAITCDNNNHLIYFFLILPSLASNVQLWSLSTQKYDAEPILLDTLYDLKQYHGLVSDGDNNLYMCSTRKGLITQYDLTEQTESEFIGNRTQAAFCKPHEMTLDSSGNLYVTDDHRISKINTKNKIVETIAGSTTGLGSTLKDGKASEAKFNQPNGIVISKDNTIYVCDTYNRCIRKLQDGIVSTVVDNDQLSQPYERESVFPSSITIHNGKLLMTDYSGGLGQINPVTRSVTRINHPDITSPRVLTTDSLGNLFIGTTRAIFKVEDMWNYVRLLWIGKLKEDVSYCHLVCLPSEIIRLVTRFFLARRRNNKRSWEDDESIEEEVARKKHHD